MPLPNWEESDLEKAILRMARGKQVGGMLKGLGAGGVSAAQKMGKPAPPPLFFILEGQAMGKPRMTQRDKWKKRPVVMRYREWCDAARESAGCTEKMTIMFPVKMTVLIFLSCPASWSRKKQLAHNGHPHTAKPDVDNVVKGIMDALFTNDSFVFKVLVEKYWTESNPHTAVTIELVEA